MAGFSGNQITHMAIGAPISRAGRDFSGKGARPQEVEPELPVAGPAASTTSVLTFPEVPLAQRIRVDLLHEWHPKVMASQWPAVQEAHPGPLVASPSAVELAGQALFSVRSSIVLPSVIALRSQPSVQAVLRNRVRLLLDTEDLEGLEVLVRHIGPVMNTYWIESIISARVAAAVDAARAGMIQEVRALMAQDRRRAQEELLLGFGGEE